MRPASGRRKIRCASGCCRMADDSDLLQAFEAWAGALLSKLEPGAQRRLATKIGTTLRRNQIERIKRQQNPDGSSFAARRPRLARSRQGAIRRGAMFGKMSNTRFLKVQNTPDGVAVGFFGRVARIARVHQEGLADDVVSGGPVYQYPARQLLGFTAADRDMIRDMLLEQLVT